MNTTTDIEKAREFSGSLRELADEATRLLADKTIDAYSINSNSKRIRVMGVRTNGKDWAYLA
jgi:hypothetical protein